MFALLFWAVLVLILVLNRFLFGKTGICDFFALMWFGCAGLSNTGLFDLHSPSWQTNLMFLGAGVVFEITYVVFRRINKREYRVFRAEEYRDEIAYIPLVALNLAAEVYCLPYLGGALQVLFTNGFSALRLTAYTESEWASTWELIFFQWVIQPIFIATALLTVVATILRFRRAKWLLLISVVDLALYVLLFGGRGIIVKFVVFTGLALFWMQSGRILSILKQYRGVVAGVCAVLVLLGYLTTQRSIAGYNIFQNVYVYVVGPFIYLGELLEAHPVGELMFWGGAMLNFVMCFFHIIGKLVFGIDYQAPDYWITTYDATYYYIGDTVSMNAMPTMIYPFLCDFGYPGIVVGTAFFACLAAWAESRFYRRPSVRAFAIFLYFGHIVIFAVQNYALFKPDSAMILIFVLLFTLRVKWDRGVLRLT